MRSTRKPGAHSQAPRRYCDRRDRPTVDHADPQLEGNALACRRLLTHAKPARHAGGVERSHSAARPPHGDGRSPSRAGRGMRGAVTIDRIRQLPRGQPRLIGRLRSACMYRNAVTWSTTPSRTNCFHSSSLPAARCARRRHRGEPSRARSRPRASLDRALIPGARPRVSCLAGRDR